MLHVIIQWSFEVLLSLFLPMQWRLGLILYLCVSIPAQGLALTTGFPYPPTTRQSYHLFTYIIQVATCPPGSQGACLDMICTYCNSHIAPSHKSYIASMWHGNIDIDHCTMGGLISRKNSRPPSQHAGHCFQFEVNQPCPQMG